MTPEGLTKNLIKICLHRYKIRPASKAGAFPEDAEGWYYMPVQSSIGVSGIPDFLGCFKGRFWAIEAKAPGKKPTGFQAMQISAIRSSGAKCFIVDGPESLADFELWVQGVSILERRK